MKATHVFPILLMFGGCYAGGTAGDATFAASADPGLVDVEPGVQVVADYDYPVFFNGGFYYRYDNGNWLRSRDYRHGGWEHTRDVPHPIARVDHPERYVHYHASREARRR